MQNDVFISTVVVVLPGTNVVTYVVQQSEVGTEIAVHADAGLPPAAAALLLLQLCGSVVPPGYAAFHIWKAENALKANFTEINDQMANVPANDEDELPF